MIRFTQDIRFLLGDQIYQLPLFLFLFLVGSMLELVGIGGVGFYVTLITKPELMNSARLSDIFELLGITDDNVLIVSGGILLIVLLLRMALTLFVNRKIFRFSAELMVEGRVRAMKFYQALPYIEHSKRHSSEYIRAILGYANNVATSFSAILLLASEGVIALVVISLLLVVDPFAVIVLLIFFFGLFFVFNWFAGPLLEDSGRLRNRSSRNATKAVQEAFLGLKELRVLGVEGYFLEKLRFSTKELGRAQVFAKLMAITPRLLIEISVMSFLLAFLFLSLLRDQELVSALPALAMFGVAALRIAPSFSLTISTVGELRVCLPSIRELAVDLRRESAGSMGQEQPTSLVIDKFSELELRGVCFQYPGNKQKIIDNLNFTMTVGDSIGLIGSSGVGKTTLVDIVLGLLSPDKGEVLFNGHSLDTVMRSWQSRVAYLPQDTFIVDEPLWKNIAVGQKREAVDFAKLTRSIKMAQLTGLIDDLDDGVNTTLGEHGMRLSGGQKQRVSLARAFYFNRDFLILDEATSSLDNETEKEIIAEIDMLKKVVTMIVITHRKPILAHCDRVYRLQDGCLKLERVN